MSQNIPLDRMQDVAERPTLQPTARTPMDVAAVPLDGDPIAQLPEAGFPDIEEQGLRYAAGQRATARATDNRATSTTGGADTGELTAGMGTQQGWANVAQPNPDEPQRFKLFGNLGKKKQGISQGPVRK